MKAKDKFRTVEPAALDEAIENLTPGETIISGITPQEYHRRPEISSGFVRCMRSEGPISAYGRYVIRNAADEDTESMKIGRIVHRALSAPDEWQSSLRFLPQCLVAGDLLERIRSKWSGRSKALLQPGDELDARTPAHREFIAEYTSDKSVEWVSQDDYDNICGIVQSVFDSPVTRTLIGRDDSDAEVIAFHRDEQSGLVLKAMADLLIVGEDFLADFKTTSLATIEKFIRHAIYDYGIAIQLAFYARVFGISKAAVIVLRSSAPYEAMWLDLPDYSIRESEAAIDWSLRKIRECREIGDYHSDGWSTRCSLAISGS